MGSRLLAILIDALIVMAISLALMTGLRFVLPAGIASTHPHTPSPR